MPSKRKQPRPSCQACKLRRHLAAQPTLSTGELITLAGESNKRVRKVAEVAFPRQRRTQLFYTSALRVKAGDHVAVSVHRGSTSGIVVSIPVKTVGSGKEYGRISRVLGAEDKARVQKLATRERDAGRMCQGVSDEMGLNMKVVDVEIAANGNKAIFYFTAEERVDFRELVRELARNLRATIEMRQIGARDETRLLGGMGPCGLEVCCSTFLGEMAPVTIKMAKNQGIALNPQKVSGVCGRLFCCLAYEDEVYSDLKKGMPRYGAVVQTPDGPGRVTESDIFRRRLRVRFGGRDTEYYDVDDTQVAADEIRREVEQSETAERERHQAAVKAQHERMNQRDAQMRTERVKRPMDAPKAEGEDGAKVEDALAEEARGRRPRGRRRPEGAAPQTQEGQGAPEAKEEGGARRRGRKRRPDGAPQGGARGGSGGGGGEAPAPGGAGSDTPQGERTGRSRRRRRRGRGQGGGGEGGGGAPSGGGGGAPSGGGGGAPSGGGGGAPSGGGGGAPSGGGGAPA
jgi:cell fate regulator YaaT (PSP1 superfamily)